MKKISNIVKLLIIGVLRGGVSAIPSLYFNLHYLPFRVAIKMPILLCKPHFNCLQGKVRIESQNIYPGMIRLGFLNGNLYPNSGITWYNKGEVVFRGSCNVGNNSHIVVAPTGYIEFGDRFSATTSLKLHSSYCIKFNENVLCGWEVTIMDSSLHPICDLERKHYSKPYGKVEIGAHNWLSTQTLIMHSVVTPPHCIFAARSMVTHSGQLESYAIHGGLPLRVLKRGVMRDCKNDHITYEKYIEE